MKAIAVINRKSGSTLAEDPATLCAFAEQTFADAGHRLECRLVEGRDLVKALESAVREPGIDAVIAGGGDGTVSAAASVCAEAGAPLGVLPLGTMNLFARSVGMPLDFEASVAGLAEGRFGKADLASANGRIFVHQFSVGFHPRLVRARNALKYGGRLSKIIASLRVTASAAANPPRFACEFTWNGHTDTRVASAISISNNPYGPGHLPYADRLDRGTLGIVVAEAIAAGELIRLSIDAVLGTLQDNERLLMAEAKTVVLKFPALKADAKSVIDGELLPLVPEVELKSLPGALKMLLPPSDDAAG